MLTDTHVLVYAATGAVSQGVARAFARQGATLWLSARDADRLAPLAAGLREVGAEVHTATVDALDAEAVRGWTAAVAAEAGGVDVVFNGIGGPPAELGYPKRTLESSLADFFRPLERILASQFLTSREAARQMSTQDAGGAIVTLSATLSGSTPSFMAGITATCGAIEAMSRALAGEFGPQGVRVNCLRPTAMPATRTIEATFAGQQALRDEPMSMSPAPLRRPITVDDAADAAVFLASPAARGITGQVLTVCGGTFVG